jgi:hypothetical protein
MRRYGVLLLVLVFTITSLMAPAAYNTVNVVSAANLHIFAAEGSPLSLTPQAGHIPGNPHGWDARYLGVGNKDGTASLVAGGLALDFSRGARPHGSPAAPYGQPGGGNHGVQPNSTYTWYSLFMIRNNSAKTVEVSLTASFAGLPAGVRVYMKAHDTNAWVLVSGGNPVVRALQARNSGDGDELYVDVQIRVSASLPVAGNLAGTTVVAWRAP